LCAFAAKFLATVEQAVKKFIVLSLALFFAIAVALASITVQRAICRRLPNKQPIQIGLGEMARKRLRVFSIAGVGKFYRQCTETENLVLAPREGFSSSHGSEQEDGERTGMTVSVSLR